MFLSLLFDDKRVCFVCYRLYRARMFFIHRIIIIVVIVFHYLLVAAVSGTIGFLL